MASLPQLQELHDELAQVDDAELILVHGSDNYARHESAQALLDEKDITIPVIEQGRPIAVEYGIKGFPTMVIVDKNGEVAYKKFSAVRTDRDRRSILDRINKIRTQ